MRPPSMPPPRSSWWYESAWGVLLRFLLSIVFFVFILTHKSLDDEQEEAEVWGARVFLFATVAILAVVIMVLYFNGLQALVPLITIGVVTYLLIALIGSGLWVMVFGHLPWSY